MSPWISFVVLCVRSFIIQAVEGINGGALDCLHFVHRLLGEAPSLSSTWYGGTPVWAWLFDLAGPRLFLLVLLLFAFLLRFLLRTVAFLRCQLHRLGQLLRCSHSFVRLRGQLVGNRVDMMVLYYVRVIVILYPEDQVPGGQT